MAKIWHEVCKYVNSVEKAQKEELEKKQAEAQKIIDEENARQKAEFDRIEKERQEKEAMDLAEKKKPDREKMIAYVEAMQSIPKPEVSEETAVRYLAQIQGSLWQALELVRKY